MALFQIFKGLESELNNVTMHEGYAYFCTDSGKFYIDVSNNTSSTDADGWYSDRIPIRGQEVHEATLLGGNYWVAGTGNDAGFYTQRIDVSDLKVGIRGEVEPSVKATSNKEEYQFIVKAELDTTSTPRGIKFYSVKQLTNNVTIQIIEHG